MLADRKPFENMNKNYKPGPLYRGNSNRQPIFKKSIKLYQLTLHIDVSSCNSLVMQTEIINDCIREASIPVYPVQSTPLADRLVQCMRCAVVNNMDVTVDMASNV